MSCCPLRTFPGCCQREFRNECRGRLVIRRRSGAVSDRRAVDGPASQSTYWVTSMNRNANISVPAVHAIAAFANRASAKALKPDIRKLFKRNILDSLGCAIAALPGAPFAALREQVAEYRSGGSCSLIGGGKAAPDQAALFNAELVRYVDLLDSYMSPGGLCHPGDNLGTILAAAEHARASGEEFMLALAVAYEIQCRFTAMVLVMAKGFNHAIQLAISTAASGRTLFG